MKRNSRGIIGSEVKLKDITPADFACAVSMACPAVLEDQDGGRFIIIGKIFDPESPDLKGRVGRDEVAIEISAELLRTALQLNKSD